MSLCPWNPKAKVNVGEPNLAVQAGARGKVSIVPSDVTVVAGDHDFHVVNLTPIVYLARTVPPASAAEDVSYYQGQVAVSVKDSIFQPSSPDRHMAELYLLFKFVACCGHRGRGGDDHEMMAVCRILLMQGLLMEQETLAMAMAMAVPTSEPNYSLSP